MPRRKNSGVIPAALLALHDDSSVDKRERASTQTHQSDLSLAGAMHQFDIRDLIAAFLNLLREIRTNRVGTSSRYRCI